ncbi:phosphatidylinositol-3-phosphatase YMR1 [Aspergillus clavatus NRRL 1]|uniref:Protein phosphatase n=1 Tax=Aspergillus clavatus (strain ATCC 1007 / CBS 513.65 / DSM 816 / NCTC 3887 / NRRL 1 / QM 1276 / 107) TaxID=344612 RepID=A1CRA2_ASPCL|nr:protein phosphatase [Aspergillus clavatus NRRL 1]EAW08173.1 protein phosphatase [Aspergillus clavatus NRRL 1]
MEKTRVAKVEDVTLARRGEQVVGTLHLTPHHIIFSHIPQGIDNAQAQGAPVRPKELWITYPIIAFCTYRPNPAASRQPSSIRLRCRDFTFVCFYFTSESKARDVYESIKLWTCKIGRIDKLYAFTYQPPPPEREINGWELYNARKEWARQGVGRDSNENGWRISEINMDYGFSPTYPALLPVPATISDNTLNYASRYRSRARVPVLTYRHPINNCSITRSSQPLVGVRQNRSIQDEKLLAAIFSTSRAERPLANFTPPPLEHDSSNSTQGDASSSRSLTELTNAEELEDEMLASFRGDPEEQPQIYGAQQHNLIVDARPTVNAFAMQAVGLGSENMDNYKFATKAYLGIDNIHVMRDSLNKVIDALKDSDVTPLGPNRDQLARSGWLKHISGILDGAGLITRQVGLQHSHVLIHCSDGWDRTGQLSALSQICLDPYFRTIEGFMVLVEKDWLSFGHMFRHRSGPLSSEKWFQIENERIGGDSSRGFGEPGGASKAIENAFLSAKGFFNRDNTSRDSLHESDGEMQSYESDGPRKPGSAPRTVVSEKEVTKVKETSPVFHQFLDATYQLLYQHPTRFEFNERFLRRLLYHLYSCQYGTFLFNSEKERLDMRAKERTRSVWDYFLARKEQFLNPQYDPQIDDHKRGKERLIFPRINEVRWWSEAFGRADAEMNGTRQPTSAPPTRRDSPSSEGTPTPVLTGIETAHHSMGSGTSGKTTTNSAPTGLAAVTSGISNLAFSKGSDNPPEPKSTMSQMELEMQ